MANTLQIKRSTTATNTPTLAAGELGVNLTDNKLWVGDGTNNLLLNPASSLGDTLYYSQDAQIQISDDSTNSNYHTMREFHCDRAGSFRIKFSAYIVSGSYWWAYRIYNATTSTVLYTGDYDSTAGSGNGLDDGQSNSVHNHRRFRVDVDADKTRVGDKILIQMVSSTSGGTPVAGNGQNLTLKEFRVYLNRQYSAPINTFNVGAYSLPPISGALSGNIDSKPDSYTKLLIHSDTTDGRGTFTDSSPSGHAISTGGDPQHKVAQKKFGASSIHFDGDDYLTIPASGDWDVGTGDWTLDCWAYTTTSTSYAYVFDTRSGSYTNNFSLYRNGLNLVYYAQVSALITATGGMTLNTWHHIALVRSGSTVTMYIDGLSVGSATDANDYQGLAPFAIGTRYNIEGYWQGYQDEFRFSKGIARWTANFTPPTRAYATFSAGDGVFTGELSAATTLVTPRTVELTHPNDGYYDTGFISKRGTTGDAASLSSAGGAAVLMMRGSSAYKAIKLGQYNGTSLVYPLILDGSQNATFSGDVSVINTDTTEAESANTELNLYKSAGGGSASRAILRVGYDLANSFQIYRWRANSNIYLNHGQGGSVINQFAGTDTTVLTSTSFYPVTSGMALGNVAKKWALNATTGNFSGALSGTTATFSGNVTVGGDLAVTGTIDCDTLDGLDSTDFMRKYGIPAGSDQYINARVIRNINAGSGAGMHIGYGNQNSGNTIIYGGGGTTASLTVASHNGTSTFAGNLTVTGTGVAKQIAGNAYSTADFNNWYTGHFTFGQLYRYDSTYHHWRDSSNNVASNAPDTPTRPLSAAAGGEGGAAYAYGGLLTLGSTSSFRGQVYMSHSGSELYCRAGWGTSSDQNWVRLVNDRNIPAVLAASALTSATFSGALTGTSATFSGIIQGGPSSTGGGVWLRQNYSGTAHHIGVIGNQYSTGAMTLGYGAVGKAGGSGYTSTLSNFSTSRSILQVGSNTLTFLTTAGAVQTAVGSDLTMVSRMSVSNTAATLTVPLTGTSATFTGVITADAGLVLNDNDKIKLGTSGDLEIYHDGSNSFIKDEGTGYLAITSNGQGIYLQKGVTETMAEFGVDGAVKLRYDNGTKFETTSTGIDVTGIITTDGLTTSGALTAPQLATTAGATGTAILKYGTYERLATALLGVNVSGSLAATGKITAGVVGTLSATFNGAVSVGQTAAPDANNKLEVNGQTRVVGGLIVGTSAIGQGAAPRALFIKGGGTQGLRIEDSTSSNYVYDLTADFTDGFKLTDVTSSIDVLTVAKTTGAASFSGDVTVGGDLAVTGTIDCDTLDGIDSTSFLRSDADDLATGILQLTGWENMNTRNCSHSSTDAGWYSIAKWGTGSGDRGGGTVVLSYEGGSWNPTSFVIKAHKNWSGTGSLSLEKHGSSDYITQVRIIHDGSSSPGPVYHLQVYLAGLSAGHSFYMYQRWDLGHTGSRDLDDAWTGTASTLSGTVIRTATFTSTTGGISTDRLNVANPASFAAAVTMDSSLTIGYLLKSGSGSNTWNETVGLVHDAGASTSYNLLSIGNDTAEWLKLSGAGTLTLGGNASVGGNLDVTGGLTVDGASTLGDSNDTTHVKGSLVVDTSVFGPSVGVLAVGAGLSVTGATTLQGVSSTYTTDWLFSNTGLNKKFIIEENSTGNSNSGIQIRKKLIVNGSHAIHNANGAASWYGDLAFFGWDGDTWRRAGMIECVSDGTPADDVMPGHLRLSTNAGGTNTTERLRIESGGTVRPGANGTQDFGATGHRWNNVYSEAGNFSGALSGTTATFSASGSTPTWLKINATSGEEGRIQFQDGGTSKWAVGNKGSDDSFVISAGAALTTSPKLTISSAGAATFSGVVKAGAGALNTALTPKFAVLDTKTLTNTSGDLYDNHVIIADLRDCTSGNNHNDGRQMGLGFACRTAIGGNPLTVASIRGVKVGTSNNHQTGELSFCTAGTPYWGMHERMRITYDGKIGIGTTGPLSLLDVFFTSGRRLLANYDDSLITLKGSNNNGDPENLRLVADDIIFNTGTSGSGSERMRITDAGNVGIGTNAPGQILHLKASLPVIRLETANSQTRIDFFDGSTGQAAIGVNPTHGDAFCISAGGNSLTNDSKLVVRPDGKVGIGTTAPDVNLHVKSSTNTAIARIEGNTAGTATGELQLEGYRTTADNGVLGRILVNNHNADIDVAKIEVWKDSSSTHDLGSFYFYTRPTGGSLTSRMVIKHDGNVGIGTAAPDTALHLRGQYDNSSNVGGYNANKGITIENFGSGADYGNSKEWGVVFAASHNTTPNNSYPVAGVMAIGNGVSSHVGGDLTFQTKIKTDASLNHRMRITNEGKVGIGTTSPGGTFHTVALPGTTGLMAVGATGNNIAQFYKSDGSTTAMLLDSDGKVGIGITAPAYKIDVVSSNHKTIKAESTGNDRAEVLIKKSGGTARSWSLAVAGSSNGYSVADKNFYIADTDGGAARLVINNSGNVGIGVVPETDWDSAHEAIQLGLTASLFSGGAATGWTQLMKNGRYVGGGVYKYITTDEASRYNQKNDGTHHFDVAASGTANAAITFTTALSIINNGNVGIGTTAPGLKLEVKTGGSASTQYALSLTNPNNQAGDGGGAGIRFSTSSGPSGVGNEANKYSSIEAFDVNNWGSNSGLSFTTSLGYTKTKSMVIDRNGNVGIGTTAPSSTLHVNSEISCGTNDDNRSMFGYELANSRFYIGTRQAGNNYFDTVTVTNGKVGIGTSAPHTNAKLDVNGNILMSGNATTRSIWNGGYGGGIQLLRSDANATRWAKIGIVDNTGGFVKGITVLDSGNVGIGTEAPGARLHVVQTGSDEAFRIDGASGGFAMVVEGGSAYNTKIRGGVTIGNTFAASAPPSNGLIIEGNVGIGTASPSAALDVRTTTVGGGIFDIQEVATAITSGYKALSLSNSNATVGNHTAINFSDTVGGSSTAIISAKCNDHVNNYGDLQFWTRGATGYGTRLHIDQEGQIGIGTTAPASNTPLHIYTNSASDQKILLDNDGGGQSGLILRTDRNSENNISNFINFEANGNLGSTVIYSTIKSYIVDNSNSAGGTGRLTFTTAVDGTDTPALHITDGKIGIGTAAPDYTLTVNAGTTNEIARFQSSDNDALISIKDDTDAVYVGLDASADIMSLGFSNSFASTNLSIDTVGKVGIGTTSPDVRLQVEDSAAGSNVDVLQLTNTSNSANSSVGMEFFSANAQFAYIRGIRTSDSNEGILTLGVRSGGSETDTLNLKGGNVGIGTSAPGSYKLYVNGNTWVQGSLETSGQLKAGTSLAIGSSGSGGYTLPATDGTNGYVLKTNGSGTVTWQADSSGGGGGSGDITSVIGGTGISVSGGTSGDATVNLDTAGADSMVNALVELTTPHEDDFIIVSDEGTSGDPVKKCKLKHLEFVNNTTYSSSGCGFTITYRDWDNQTLDTVSITLSCGGGGS